MRSPALRCAVAVAALAISAGCGSATDEPGDAEPSARSSTAPVVPACPASGLLVEAGEVEGALGLRALSMTATACGDAPVRVGGYARIRVLDVGGRDLDVPVVEGTDSFDDPQPSSFVVAPGRSAAFSLVWRGTVADVARPPLSSRLVAVAATGGAFQRVPLAGAGLDLGTSPRLEVTAWERVRVPAGRR